MSVEATTTEQNTQQATQPQQRVNGAKRSEGQAGQQRVIKNPNDVAALVLMQVDAINAKKDELTLAVKNLTDLTKQLAKVYGEQAKAIHELQARVNKLESENKSD